MKPINAVEACGTQAGCCWHVLVVDDEPLVAAMFKIVLESSGHQVTTVPDAVKALAALMEQDFDLAVVDLTLPEMDGWEVLGGSPDAWSAKQWCFSEPRVWRVLIKKKEFMS